jgi:2'-5' RNA ligase
MDAEQKRLFFGFEVSAPWPIELPHGKLLKEADRHMTLAFLGQMDYSSLMDKISLLPPLPFKVGLSGQFDKCLFLPEKHPHVVAWHMDWLGEEALINAYHQHFVQWLKNEGFNHDTRELMPHMTLCRTPFNVKQWEKSFLKLPFFLKNLHLYESLGHSNYSSCWSYPCLPSFEEIDHTADIAFLIHGEHLAQLHKNALIALAFKFPLLLEFHPSNKDFNSLDEIIISLNAVVAKADEAFGCPFKAISFHGEMKENENCLSWEMIVDV